MNNSIMQNALLQAAVLTFEELGFFFHAPELEDKQKNKQTDVATKVDFRGAAEGTIVLRICPELREVIAANMLGDDEPLSADLQRDALGEFANVICGNALPAIFGKHEVFRLAAPQYFTTDDLTADNFTTAPKASVRVNMEEGCADVLLFLN